MDAKAFATYPAFLIGDHIEWKNGDRPPLPLDERVQIRVTLVDGVPPISDEERGRLMCDALDAIAAAGTFDRLDDPVAWQREQRQDRDLPGRSE